MNCVRGFGVARAISTRPKIGDCGGNGPPRTRRNGPTTPRRNGPRPRRNGPRPRRNGPRRRRPLPSCPSGSRRKSSGSGRPRRNGPRPRRNGPRPRRNGPTTPRRNGPTTPRRNGPRRNGPPPLKIQNRERPTLKGHRDCPKWVYDRKRVKDKLQVFRY